MHLIKPATAAITVGGIGLLWPAWAAAHNPFTEPGQTAVLTAAFLLAAMWLSYCLGCLKQRPTPASWWLFNSAGTLSLITLFGPLDHWAETNSAAHMVQHMLMMVVIAPLWVIARPLPQWYAVQPHLTGIIVKPLLHLARQPMIATGIHGAIIWLWHTPVLYVLALENLWWHLFEHLCFLVSAGVFWWSVLRSQHRNTPSALLALLATLMHTGLLGALLTFSETSWYGEQRLVLHQQLAGLLMWVLGGVPYLAAAFYLGWRWFNRIDKTTMSSASVD
jgi:putative membrane protein